MICRRRSARETRLARASYPGHATGFDEPWRLLAEDLSDVTVSTLGFGTGYLAHAHTRPGRHLEDGTGRHEAPARTATIESRCGRTCANSSRDSPCGR